MPGASYSTIYELAADQLGYFTIAQARQAGVTPMAVVMMERRGVVERISRGVYRLVLYPIEPLSQYMEATLWPAVIEGVISHDSALALYGISDVSPDKVHITLPTAFRIRRSIPGHLVIHHADFGPEDWQYFEGIRVTTPARTIRDCAAADLGDALIRQAIRDGRREGLLNQREADLLAAELLMSRQGQEA